MAHAARTPSMLATEIKVTPELVAEHGLTPEEYARIQKILGREPNFTELGIFSVMWSEHCSYKSSRVHLKRLPTRAPQVLQGPGENAGVVDVGDGLAAVFKMESHNHPSYVEPFQGAATGVGGILRDVFTMGARPIAVLDSLRFGSITPATWPAPEIIARNRRLVDGVVRGIAFYGNCFGVPTVGGEVAFEPGYAGNPLVNVLALGIAPKDQLFFARARGEGNPVIYVGAKTGRDGIHGASLLASAEFTEESQQKRPNVQVGDPFLEKLLLEACLEAMATGAIVGIQDMGAAGLTSTSCEMASRGGVGIEIELDRVPQRETGMTAYEMMLSESQERMLLVAERGREAEVFASSANGDSTPSRSAASLPTASCACCITARSPRKFPPMRWPSRRPSTSARSRRRSLQRRGTPAFRSRRRRRPHRKFPTPARRSGDRLEALDLRAVRSHGAHQHDRRSGRGRCRRRSAQGHEPCPRALHRRQRPLVRARSARRRHARRRRSRAQRRRGRRAPLGRHELPQFRQSRKARSHVAVQRSHRRHLRSLPRAFHPDHRRQCQLL